VGRGRESGVSRVQVKEAVVGTRGERVDWRTRGESWSEMHSLDASEREEGEGLPHAVPARAAF